MITNIKSGSLCNLKMMAVVTAFIALFVLISFEVVHAQFDREPDNLKYFSGSGNSFLINDSTMIYYGSFYLTSASKNFKISARRLKLKWNYFENDFLSGRVYKEITDLYMGEMVLGNIVTFKADSVDSIRYSKNSLVIKLRGNVKISGDDVLIETDNINLNLDVVGGETTQERYLRNLRMVEEARKKANN